MSDPKISTRVTNASKSEETTNAASDVASKKDASEIFWECSALCYMLFTALGAVGQFINNQLKKYNADFNVSNSAQTLLLDSGPPPANPPLGDEKTFPLGGDSDTADGKIIATKRANDLLDALHSFGLAMDFPLGYATNPSLKVDDATRRTLTVGKFKEWGTQLNNNTDRIKNSATLESTKAEGAMKSSNAAIELATSIVKSLSTMAQTISSSMKT